VSRQPGGRFREGYAGPQRGAAQAVGLQVLVAQQEPGLFGVLPPQLLHEGPGFVGAAPSQFGVADPAQRINQRVDVGADVEAEVVEIITRVRAARAPVAAARLSPSASLAPPMPLRARRSVTGTGLVLGRNSGVPARCVAQPGKTTHDYHRLGFGALPHQAGAPAASVARPTSVTCIGRPTRSGSAAGRAGRAGGHADRGTHRAVAPGAAEAVDDDDTDAAPAALPQRNSQSRGGGIGVERQQDGVARCRVRLVDAGVGHHQAEPVFDDDHLRALAQHLHGFIQDQLHQGGVLAGLPAAPAGFFRRRHIGQADHPALGLGDDFLGDDHDVVVLQRE
jgi:hypothetical protein